MLKLKNKEGGLVVGVGSALVDILAHADDKFLDASGASKGSMKLVAHNAIEDLIDRIESRCHIVPGGSACNTAIGVGRLGGVSRFVGKCGKDDFGTLCAEELKKNKVEPKLFDSDSPTGRVLSIITPDAERSMLTYLGASAEAHPSEMQRDCFENASIVHIEGYLLFNRDLILSVLERAKEAGAAISLDLASYDVVKENHSLLGELVNEYVDILIANEDEAKAYTGHDDFERAALALAENVQIGALKVGARGSFLAHGSEVIRIRPKERASAVDTTGAGDLWAAGFLYGLANGMSLEKSGELGSLCGYEVVQVVGASIPETGWERIRKFL